MLHYVDNIKYLIKVSYVSIISVIRYLLKESFQKIYILYLRYSIYSILYFLLNDKQKNVERIYLNLLL